MAQEVRVLIGNELAEALDAFREERDGLNDRSAAVTLILSLALSRYLPHDDEPTWQLGQMLSGSVDLTVGEIKFLLQGLGVLDHEFGAMGDLHEADRISAEAKLSDLLAQLKPRE